MKSLLIASKTSNQADLLLSDLHNSHRMFEVSHNIGNAKHKIDPNVNLVLFDLMYFTGDILQAVSDLTTFRNYNNLRFELIILYDKDHDSGNFAIELINRGVNAFVPNDLGEIVLPARIEEILIKCSYSPLRKNKYNNVFVATPYSNKMDYILDYNDSIAPALQFLNLIDVGPMRYKSYKSIPSKILNHVHRAAVGIMNVSPEYEQKNLKGVLGKRQYWKTNPNVAFELGLMIERKTPVVIICQEHAWSEGGKGILSDIQGLELLIYESRIHLTYELINRLTI